MISNYKKDPVGSLTGGAFPWERPPPLESFLVRMSVEEKKSLVIWSETGDSGPLEM